MKFDQQEQNFLYLSMKCDRQKQKIHNLDTKFELKFDHFEHKLNTTFHDKYN